VIWLWWAVDTQTSLRIVSTQWSLWPVLTSDIVSFARIRS